MEKKREQLDGDRKRDIMNSKQKLEPLVQGHMFKQDSHGLGFSKRYFVLYEGLLLYYTHEKDFKRDQKRGLVRHR